MAIDRQEVVFYKVEDDIDTKEIRIPKIINTDVSFELMFGIKTPRQNWTNDIKRREKIEYLNIYETYYRG